MPAGKVWGDEKLTNTDMKPSKQPLHPWDAVTALSLLTRLPVPYRPSAARTPAHAAWAYPLVGLVVGAIALCVGWIFQTLGAAAPITAFFTLATSIMVTGALHEDGLADCADGFWGGWTVERRLEIMKDSVIGTYGVIALVLSLILRWYVLTLMIDKGALVAAVLVSAVMSRAAMVWVMYGLRNARMTGLSVQTGRPNGITTLIALAIAVAAACAVPEISAVTLLFFAGLVTLGAGLLARVKIAGQTGDVLGATQVLVEITVLVAFDIMISTWDG